MPSDPTQKSLASAYTRIAAIALLSRLIVLLGKTVSCHFIPDFNPSDDVLSFNLRMNETRFCLSGHDCDLSFTDSSSRNRADSFLRTNSRLAWLDAIYFEILPPVTRWDSARFLALALQPLARSPQNTNMTFIQNSECSTDPFLASEQSHAFLPLLPLLIRVFSKNFIKLVPIQFLPPTYEALLALSGLLLSITTFIFASLLLFDLTLQILKTKNSYSSSSISSMAQTTVLLFCFNPANVFFTSSYSESMFAMLNFAGYTLATRGYLWLGVVPWMAATYTRSNGTLISIWIALRGIAKLLTVVRSSQKRKWLTFQCLGVLLYHVSLAILVISPFWYHDYTGYMLHCHHHEPKPIWCREASQKIKFSLYSHIQRKYWNVGWFRYYQMKQIPNFILASPILVISLMGTIGWIRQSWIRYGRKRNDSEVITIKRPISTLIELLHWAIFALRESQSTVESETAIKDADTSKKRNEPQSSPATLLLGPSMLPHYAILAGVALVGLIIAHVQISTRMICSSCPAVYWYLTVILLEHDQESVSGFQNCLGFQTRKVLWWYFGLYNVLGIVMHVNWLPWT